MKNPILFMDQLLPVFNAVEGVNFGISDNPDTLFRRIRYSIADYKRLLSLFLREYITGEGPWTGPFATDVSLYADAAYTGGIRYQLSTGTSPPYFRYRMGTGGNIEQLTGNSFHIDDVYDAQHPELNYCPLLPEGEASFEGEREGADFVESASGEFGCLLDLFSPAIPESSWKTATHVWLFFAILSNTVSRLHSYNYRCDGGLGATTSGGPGINNNVLGIDYAGRSGDWIPGLGPPITGALPLGDGSTSLYLWSPTGNRFELDTLNTRIGLD